MNLLFSVFCFLLSAFFLLSFQRFDLNSHAAERDAGGGAIAADFFKALVAEARAGDEHFGDLLLGADAPERTVAAEDAITVYDLALLQRIIVHESDRRQLQLAVVQDLAQQQLARVARAIDQDAAACVRRPQRQHQAEQAERSTAAS